MLILFWFGIKIMPRVSFCYNNLFLSGSKFHLYDFVVCIYYNITFRRSEITILFSYMFWLFLRQRTHPKTFGLFVLFFPRNNIEFLLFGLRFFVAFICLNMRFAENRGIDTVPLWFFFGVMYNIYFCVEFLLCRN